MRFTNVFSISLPPLLFLLLPLLAKLDITHAWVFEAYPLPQPPTRGSLICAGAPPVFELPAHLQIGRYNSLLSICAKPAYGGSITLPTAGGWCAWMLDPPRIAFDPAIAGAGIHDANPLTEGLRLAHLCRTKCRCVFNEQAAYSPGVEVRHQLAIRPQVINFTPIQHFRPDRSFDDNAAHGQQHLVPMLYLDERVVEEYNLHAFFKVEYITGPKDMTIECMADSPLPPLWSLPSYLEKSQYPNAQALCASSFSGGLLAGSLGGYCNPSNLLFHYVDFSNELAAAGTTIEWRGPMMRGITLSWRMWCMTKCWCARPRRTQPMRPAPIIPWLNNGRVVTGDGGLVFRIFSGGRWQNVRFIEPDGSLSYDEERFVPFRHREDRPSRWSLSDLDAWETSKTSRRTGGWEAGTDVSDVGPVISQSRRKQGLERFVIPKGAVWNEISSASLGRGLKRRAENGNGYLET